MSCFPCKPLLTHQTRRVNYAVAGFSFKKGLRREADFAFAPGSHQTMGPSINYKNFNLLQNGNCPVTKSIIKMGVTIEGFFESKFPPI